MKRRYTWGKTFRSGLLPTRTMIFSRDDECANNFLASLLARYKLCVWLLT